MDLYELLLKKNAPGGKVSKRRNPFYLLQFKYQSKDAKNKLASFLGSTSGLTEAKKHSFLVKKDVNGDHKLMMLEGGSMEDDIRMSVREPLLDRHENEEDQNFFDI